ncbi:MAG: alpha-amylase, partial [Bacteroidaceae bacterium]|nr:alpha-amylase [Bacteroidaceae bacterium]
YTTIHNQGEEIAVKDKEISRLRARLEKYEPKEEVAEEKVPASKAPAKKPAVAKAASAPKKAATSKKSAKK